MKKKAHILLTGRIACRLVSINDAPLLWGSIMPDLLVFTYLRPHTWENTRRKIFRMMRHLSKTGCTGNISALRLGYIIHYIEDYFTYPHNINFEGSIEDHVRFENEEAGWLTGQLIEKNAKPGGSVPAEMAFTDINDVIAGLEKMHAEYMESTPGFENDFAYAAKAVSMVCTYYEYAFAANEKRFFEFPLCPDMDYIVDIPKFAAKICLMTIAERKAA